MRAIKKVITFYNIILALLLLVCIKPAIAQETSLVQVKTFDLRLKPIANLELSFDQQHYFATGTNGSVIVEINNTLLPPKVIYFIDVTLEAESWNYSKGILEIIVREKSFETYELTFVDNNNIPLKNIAVSIEADLPIKGVTNRQGALQLDIPVNLDLQKPEMFKITGYRILATDFNGTFGIITAAALPTAPTISPVAISVQSNKKTTFDEDQLYSIQSLPVFYNFLTDLDMTILTIAEHQLLDVKFDEVYIAYTDSLSRNDIDQGNISDTSQVSNDILFLTRQALLEGRAISQTRADFNKELAVINDKIGEGGGNLSDAEREKLLHDITALDDILIANEEIFTKNQSYYKSSISDIKNRLLNIEDLEAQLSDVERQRQAEQDVFRKQLFISVSIAIGLLFLVLLFIYLIRKISRQKKAIHVAHEEVKEINDHLEELVAKRTKTLQRVNTELDTFLYRSSHDLKRPLSSIIGLANIAKITLNEEANELFEKARKTADDMDKLLQKLITISQINYSEDYAKIDFSAMLKKIHNECQETIVEKGTEINYSIADNIEFASDPKLMECIFKNLIDNALLYSSFSEDKQPKVEVAVYSKDASLYLEIKDNGEGISKEIKSKIWNMFYRGHANSSGNGLGLYITRRAVKVLKGSISFETITGKFTKFIVQLPYLDQKALKAKSAAKKPTLEPV